MRIRRFRGFDVGGRLRDARRAIALVAVCRDSRAVAFFVAASYLLAYLWAVRDLSFRPGTEPDFFVVSNPVEAVFARTGPAAFEAVALLDVGLFRLLVSPLNLAIGIALAALVGLSIALTYLAIVQPKACGIGAGSGLLASVPALLSGTACCGPIVLIAFGIQASGLLFALFAWLLPIGVVLLLGSIFYLTGKIDVRPEPA